jgi:hypothetical protein
MGDHEDVVHCILHICLRDPEPPEVNPDRLEFGIVGRREIEGGRQVSLEGQRRNQKPLLSCVAGSGVDPSSL